MSQPRTTGEHQAGLWHICRDQYENNQPTLGGSTAQPVHAQHKTEQASAEQTFIPFALDSGCHVTSGLSLLWLLPECRAVVVWNCKPNKPSLCCCGQSVCHSSRNGMRTQPVAACITNANINTTTAHRSLQGAHYLQPVPFLDNFTLNSNFSSASWSAEV